MKSPGCWRQWNKGHTQSLRVGKRTPRGGPAMTTQSRLYRSYTDLKERYVRWEREEKLLKYQVIESNRGSKQWRLNSILSQTPRIFTSSKLTTLKRTDWTNSKWPSFLTILIGTKKKKMILLLFSIFFIRERMLHQVDSFLAQADTNHFLVTTK